MAGAFPTLKSGNTVFYPLTDTSSFGTQVAHFCDDSEQRWVTRSMLKRFKLGFNRINTYDMSLILQFLRSQFGQFDNTWTLTFGGNTYSNLGLASDLYQFVEDVINYQTASLDIVQVQSALPSIPGATPYFPQINSGGVTIGLPYTNGYLYHTTVADVIPGKRYTYKWRSNPLGKFALTFPRITDAEVTVLQNFVTAMQGRFYPFAYMDPGGNLVPYSDAFSNAAWTRTTVTVGSPASDPFGGSLATTLTGTGSNSEIVTQVVPAGNVNGYVMCASVWVKALSAAQNLQIGLVDSLGGNQISKVWAIPQNVWVRISVSGAISSVNPISLFIGGGATWGTTSINMFSAQVSNLPGPGPRLLTPGFDALRPVCRFDTDDLVVERIDYNTTQVTLPILEYV